jgi:hypothetical protein
VGAIFEGRKHLIQAVKERPAINAKGHLFVIVGRRTFSAKNAVDFRKDTNAILVGEPIGERPNSATGKRRDDAPHSRLVVSYPRGTTSSWTKTCRRCSWTSASIRADGVPAGRDPVMDWILSN